MYSQGVVSICSPVKTAFAPAMKHIACSDSAKVFRPAARRMIVVGIAMRAVAIVRIKVWYGTGYWQSQKKKATGEGLEIYIIAFERGARNRYKGVDRERFRVFGHAGDGSK